MKRIEPSNDALDWDAKATEALEAARDAAGARENRSSEKGWHVAQCRRHTRCFLCEAPQTIEVRPPQLAASFMSALMTAHPPSAASWCPRTWPSIALMLHEAALMILRRYCA